MANCDAARTPSPTVFVVDGDPLAANSVAHLARTMNLGCECFTAGRAFLGQIDPARSGCVVLEVRVPDINGLEIQRQIATRGVALPVVFLSGHATVSIAVQAMRAGALHFLQKPAREHELWAALEEAVSRDARVRQQRLREAQCQERMAILTAADWRLFKMLLAGHLNREIASEWGISTRAIELRRSKLMRKLGIRTTREMVRLVIDMEGGALPPAIRSAIADGAARPREPATAPRAR
jgi:FixJ family two-component response regulator